MAKNKKRHKPVDGSEFSQIELDYIGLTAKNIEWPVQCFGGAYIHVPFDEIDKAEDDLFVRHLRNDYGFIIQGCITVDKNRVFDVAFKKRREVERPTDEKIVEIGDVYMVYRTKEKLKCVQLRENDAMFKAEGQISNPTAYTYAVIKQLIHTEGWVKC